MCHGRTSTSHSQLHDPHLYGSPRDGDELSRTESLRSPSSEVWRSASHPHWADCTIWFCSETVQKHRSFSGSQSSNCMITHYKPSEWNHSGSFGSLKWWACAVQSSACTFHDDAMIKVSNMNPCDSSSSLLVIRYQSFMFKSVFIQVLVQVIITRLYLQWRDALAGWQWIFPNQTLFIQELSIAAAAGRLEEAVVQHILQILTQRTQDLLFCGPHSGSGVKAHAFLLMESEAVIIKDTMKSRVTMLFYGTMQCSL